MVQARPWSRQLMNGTAGGGRADKSPGSTEGTEPGVLEVYDPEGRPGLGAGVPSSAGLCFLPRAH